MINRKFITIVMIVVIIVCIGFFVFVYEPETSQKQLYPYNNTEIPQRTGFIQEAHCPIDPKDNITPMGTIEELKDDLNIVGSRIYVNGVFYCHKHHIWFNVH
ncbi:MAG: hypothetical protein LBM02_09425 [Lachnospiraceae bacterium]|jgi:hypothetical protein|nr:hypothetical protein [Lachnospiraceae bacterium]